MSFARFARTWSWLVVLAAPVASGQTTEWYELLPTPSIADQLFGSAVATDGDVAVVGAPNDATNGPQSGTAYVFAWDANAESWNPVQQLFPSLPQSLALFGGSVAVDGDTIAVGAQGDAGAATSEGAVYVFRFDSSLGQWLEVARVLSPTPAAQGLFGFDVDVEDDALAVGATNEARPSGGITGAAHVLRLDASGIYQLESTVHRPNSRLGEQFGYHVDLRGNALAVAAPFVFGSPGRAFDGAVEIFQLAGGAWTHVQALKGTDRTDDFFMGQMFGLGMSLDGEWVAGARLAVGAPFDDLSGAIHVYQHDGTQFVLETRLFPPAGDADADGNLGMSVALRENLLVGGKPREDNSGFTWTGSAHCFRFHPRSGWVDDVKLEPTNPAADDFGTHVAIGTEQVLIGAPSRTVAGNAAAGSVFTYPADEIVVDLDPDSPPPDSDMVNQAFFGEPGLPVLVAIVDVNGVPTFTTLFLATYGADRRFHFDGRTPNATFGLTLGFQAFEISPTGRIVASDVEFNSF